MNDVLRIARFKIALQRAFLGRAILRVIIFIVPCPEQLSSTCHFIIRYQKVQLLFFCEGLPITYALRKLLFGTNVIVTLWRSHSFAGCWFHWRTSKYKIQNRNSQCTLIYHMMVTNSSLFPIFWHIPIFYLQYFGISQYFEDTSSWLPFYSSQKLVQLHNLLWMK